MTDCKSRRGDRSLRTWEREMEILRIVADAERHAATEAEPRARYDARAEAAARLRAWFCDHLHTMEPAPGQRHECHLEPLIGLPVLAKGKKGREVFKLMAGDIEAAERLAKRLGVPLEDAIEAFAKVNALNTPSYEGGELLEKGAKVKAKNLKKLAKAHQSSQSTAAMAQFIANHKMTGTDNAVDAAVFKALYVAARQPVAQRPGQPITTPLGFLSARR